MYKVYAVEGGYQIFWYPSAPMHYQDKIPHNDWVYSKKQAAYRRNEQRMAMKSEQEGIA